MENIETINSRLERYGRYLDGRPLWRIIFSEDEMEKRFGTFTDITPEGLFIREVTEVREIPKYRQYINPPSFILERLMEVPSVNQQEITVKTSYEPIWVFKDQIGNPVYPVWPAIELVIKTVIRNMTEGVEKPHNPQDDLKDPEIYKESHQQQINNLVRDLFGNETRTTDSLAYGEGIVVPANYRKDAN